MICMKELFITITKAIKPNKRVSHLFDSSDAGTKVALRVEDKLSQPVHLLCESIKEHSS